MKNHPYKLLVVDIDGTLVNASGNISPEDKQALAQVQDSGIWVSLCTGRGIKASLRIIDQLSLENYHIFFDGALVGRPSQNEEVYAQPISQAVVREMIELAHFSGLNLELFTVADYFAERESWSTNAQRQFFGIPPTLVDFNQVGERERIIKGMLVTTTPQEAAQASQFRQHFNHRLHFSVARTPAYPGVDFINLLSPGVSKGKALAILTAHLGVSLDEVMAVGDGVNDISLLTKVGLAIAMGNAPDEVKAVADQITLDIDHSGLAVAIQQFLP